MKYFFLLFLTALTTVGFAQSTPELYTSEWQIVAQYKSNGLPKSADSVSMEIYKKATAANNYTQRQIVKKLLLQIYT